ncbi:MAG: sulfatase-like hydrolase/transferase [Bacteroidota bacterium]
MRVLLFLILSILLGSCSAAKKDIPAIHSPKPNIILIMVDDLGWGDVGFNGNTKVKTPHLDELAAKGFRLSRFYSAAPVCSPTRASCLTGRNPNRMGIPGANAGHMLKEEVTLAEVLRGMGYRTGHFGKWHLGTLTTQIKDANRGKAGDSTHYSIPSMHGYDAYFCTESKVPTYDPLIKPLSFDTTMGESLRYGWSAALESNEEVEDYGTWYWTGIEQRQLENMEGENTQLIIDEVLSFIKANESPFFTTIWPHTPHLPVVASKKYRDMYAGLSHREQLYYGSITAMDEQIGRLWKFLEERGEAKNTMLWFCSDNGPENRTPGSAGPFRERKRSLYEGGLRVPAFMLWPEKFSAGQELDFPMFTSDYLPTILDLLELETKIHEYPLDGISLRYVLEGKKDVRGQGMGFMHRNGAKSWVNQQYKLISPKKDAPYELYDLLKDPSEEQNIVSQEGEIFEKMKAELESWLASVERSNRGEDYP